MSKRAKLDSADSAELCPEEVRVKGGDYDNDWETLSIALEKGSMLELPNLALPSDRVDFLMREEDSEAGLKFIKIWTARLRVVLEYRTGTSQPETSLFRVRNVRPPVPRITVRHVRPPVPRAT